LQLGRGAMANYLVSLAYSEKIKYADLPDGIRGLGSVFMIAGLMAWGFQSFTGIFAVNEMEK